ncbi:HK97 family phage prohead protease [Falsirhodobacter halotolerans]|uniref:HK97 family phage prohead protease n=1 Tax=Falsirhodobacter halotolerans TaxID=1146892 RepID=UPI001FD4BBED|nr:HK97 family phage prohead protease [Falsirhodobacter halotolerans]MCJ8139507.1 HK97 family phage prohead protease [Falsirhodobacter halotolerans]
MMETKDFALELKEISPDGVVEGYAAIFGNIDLGGDRLSPGAFVEGLAAATKAKRTIKMLWQHDPSAPIGVWDDLVEDRRGLKVKGRMIMDVPKAKEVHALMKGGAIGGLSMGYRVTRWEYEEKIRVLHEVDLYEVSAVTFPMNEKARITAVKSDGIEDIVTKLAAGDRLTEREFERMAKGLGLSNSQAERAARIHLKGQGEPATAANDVAQFLAALRA